MKRLGIYLVILLFSDACVDRLFFDVENSDQGILVVDGQITNEPGPYSVRLSRSSSADDILNFAQPVNAKKITLFDNAGASEVLINRGEGLFETDANGMRGAVGKKYHIEIELLDGTIFESIPDEMKPVGKIDSLYYTAESYLPIQGPTQYGFRIFIDSTTPTAESYARWRFTGTFAVETFPRLKLLYCNCCNFTGPPDPLPCSGFVWTGTFLKKVAECSCCISYVNDYENKPHLNDNEIVTNGTFKKVEMGYVPFNQWTFSRGKYMLKVEQMSLSREAYDFWKIFRDQKEGTTSLFQPAFGRAKTSIFSTNTNKVAAGIFYAAAIQKKIVFITAGEASVAVPPFDILPPETNCTLWTTGDKLFLNASTVPPPGWN